MSGKNRIANILFLSDCCYIEDPYYCIISRDLLGQRINGEVIMK